ncbi:MAG: B12-binding domain-containing radical SAM protein [Nitrospinota bacterium]
MRYHHPLYRPPSEAGSLLIQATIGCPHNRCTFCGMYAGVDFRIRPTEEVKEDLRMAHDSYGPYVKTLFFPDGNTLCMKTEELAEILRFARELFPGLKRVTLYGSARFIVRKKLEGLKRLREAGLDRIHSGFETGDGRLLEKIRKGFSPEAEVEAGELCREAGIELSAYIIIGLGGTEGSRSHALESARVLNLALPRFVRLRTLVPRPGTPVWREYHEGAFGLLSPHEALAETRLLIESLEGPFELLSDHISNYWNLVGKIPEDRARLLNEVDHALSLDPSSFRPALIGVL